MDSGTGISVRSVARGPESTKLACKIVQRASPDLQRNSIRGSLEDLQVEAEIQVSSFKHTQLLSIVTES